jgi:hypothetical protein
MESILAAEYTSGTNKYPPTLYINRITNGRRSSVAAFTVSGKPDLQQGAEPWNF